MGTLLKDMPIHMERIENNYSLKGKIEDILSEDAEFENNGTELSNPEVLAATILSELTDFVNQNYEWKGLKA